MSFAVSIVELRYSLGPCSLILSGVSLIIALCDFFKGGKSMGKWNKLVGLGVSGVMRPCFMYQKVSADDWNGISI